MTTPHLCLACNNFSPSSTPGTFYARIENGSCLAPSVQASSLNVVSGRTTGLSPFASVIRQTQASKSFCAYYTSRPAGALTDADLAP